MIFSFLLLKAIEPLFDQRAVSKVEAQPDIRSSVVRNPKFPNPPSQNFDAQPQKVGAGGAKSNEPERVSPSILKVRLEPGAVALERKIRFDPQPLDRRADAQSLGLAEVGPQPILTETFQTSQKERIVTASAGPEHPLPTPPQELKASNPEDTSAKNKAAEASANVLTTEQAAYVKWRLRDLGYLSLAKGSEWDASARNALRDFKVANNLRNDDMWDLETSNKLNSQTAVRADHSMIGNWSSVPCRSAKPTDIRLSISSRRSRSSAGSVCEFYDMKATAREWRVKATCSQGGKHWAANGKFSLTAEKLVWTSERDVISYFRCH
jgi:hypothetical protein